MAAAGGHRGPGPVPGRRGVAGPGMAGRAGNARTRPRERLLRHRRRVALGRPTGVAHPLPGTRVQRRRRLRPPPAGRDGGRDRRQGRRRRLAGVVQPTATDLAGHPLGADPARRAAVRLLRGALAGLPADGGLGAAPVRRFRLPARGQRLAAGGRAAPLRGAVRTDGDRGGGGKGAAGRPASGRLPPRRPGPPAAVARRADRPPGRLGRPGRCPMGHLLRPRARGEDRTRRRPAHRPAGDRAAADRGRGGDRARGRPLRLLDRRRHRPDRRDPDRRPRHGRGPQHARPGHPDRPRRRGRPRLGRLRPGPDGSAVGRFARGAGR